MCWVRLISIANVTLAGTGNDYSNREVSLAEQESIVSAFGMETRDNLITQGQDFVPIEFTLDDLETTAFLGTMECKSSDKSEPI